MLDVSPWPGLELIHRIEEGARNEVWRGQLNGLPVAARRSRRSPASLAWELDLISELHGRGFLVPNPLPAADGRPSADGIVVQHWIGGHAPETTEDWKRVADELQRLHAVMAGHSQRPGSCTVTELTVQRTCADADLDAMPADVRAQVVAIFDSVADLAVSLIHGDPDDSNLRITDDGRVGLLDWDESRVDVTWHDLSNLGVTVLDASSQARAERLSHAWEVANGWVVEPDYARRRLKKL